VSYEFGKLDFEFDKSKGYKLFPPVHFKQDSYPSVSDLLNLPRFTSFCQVDTADNVKRFRTRRAPDPDPRRREAVHARNKKSAMRNEWSRENSMLHPRRLLFLPLWTMTTIPMTTYNTTNLCFFQESIV
jgi:hypothetical protein